MPIDDSNNELENEQSVNYVTTLLLFLWRDQKICVKQEKSYFSLAQPETSIWNSKWLLETSYQSSCTMPPSSSSVTFYSE